MFVEQPEETQTRGNVYEDTNIAKRKRSCGCIGVGTPEEWCRGLRNYAGTAQRLGGTMGDHRNSSQPSRPRAGATTLWGQHSTVYSTANSTVQYSVLYSTVYCTVHFTVHCTVQCTVQYSVQYSTVYCTVQYCTVQCTVQYSVQYSTVQCTVQYSVQYTVLYTVLYSTVYRKYSVLYCTVQYSTVYCPVQCTVQYSTVYSTMYCIPRLERSLVATTPRGWRRREDGDGGRLAKALKVQCAIGGDGAVCAQWTMKPELPSHKRRLQ